MKNPSVCTAVGAPVSYTTAPIGAGDVAPCVPEFGEVFDVQRIFGIRRTQTFNLIREGKIRSVLLRRPGGKSGKRLVHLQSVREFLFKQMEEATR